MSEPDRQSSVVFHLGPTPARAVLFGAAYFLCAVVGNLLSLKSVPFVNFWLPGGLFVATLLLNERRIWPVLVFAAVIANNCFDLLNGKTFPVSLLFSLSNSLEAVLGAWLVLRFTGNRPTFAKSSEVTCLILFSAVLSPAVGATIGATVVTALLGAHSFQTTWLTWWSSDALGVLLLAPLALVWLPTINRAPSAWTWSADLIKAVALMALLSLATVFLFSDLLGYEYPHKYFLFPFVLLLAVKYKLHGATAANLLVAVITSILSVLGSHDMAVATLTPLSQVISLQFYLFVLISIALFSASIITERNLAVEALQKANDFLTFAQKSARSGVWCLDLVTGRLTWSPEQYRLFGVDPTGDALALDTWLDVIHPEDRQTAKSALTRAISEHLQLSHVYRIIKPNGETRWINCLGETIYDEVGNAGSMSGISLDITESREAHETIRKRENVISQLLQSTDQGIYGTDLAGNCTFINKAGLHMLGYQGEDCFGNNMHSLIHHSHPDGLSYPEGECPIFLAKLTGEGCRLDDEVLWRKDGTYFNAEYSSYPILENGVIVGAVVTFSDITERKNHEKEKQALERQFQQTQKLESLGVLTGGIAHDFNNILTIIMAQCSLAKIDSDTIHNVIPEIEKAAGRAADLCRQMLAYAGKSQLLQAPVNVKALVDEMVKMLKATIPQNCVITCDSQGNLPVITGDASQISQVVMNLVINASEAIGSAQGQIRLSLAEISITADDPVKDFNGKAIGPGKYVCLEVTDNGCGMDVETTWRVFEPFYTTKSRGCGLGMSAVLGIVTAHNGALQLSSEPGQGTAFKIYLPVQPGESVRDEPVEHDDSLPLKGCGTILFVEDEVTLLLSMGYMLKKLGFTVVEATNGKEALELFLENQSDIDLVLTDMGMPVMDGCQLFLELKKINPRLPIIISSGYGDPANTSLVAHEYMAGSLIKPYTFEQLQEAVKKAVENVQQ